MMWIVGKDAEVPETVPVERAIEIVGCAESAILPVKEDIAEVEVALCPVVSEDIIGRVDTHQIVEVNLKGCLILFLREVKLVSHLVCEEESLLLSLLITHGTC